MKATELIKALEYHVIEYGDIDVYYSYDGGILVECDDVDYYLDIERSPYHEDPEIIPEAIVINYSTE